MRRAALPVLLLFLLAACGHRGPLYLPKEGDKNYKSAPRKTEEGTIEK